jgi:hypothetical protein
MRGSSAGCPGVERRQMVGYLAAFVNGNMFAGTHQDALVLRLPEDLLGEFMTQAVARPFEPMPGRPMEGYAVAVPLNPRSDEHTDVTIEPLAQNGLRLFPYPLDKAPLEIAVLARQLLAHAGEPEAAAREDYHRAPRLTLAWQLLPERRTALRANFCAATSRPLPFCS